MIKGKNILIQEEEFLKLNAEIDLKTENLLNQMDQLKELQLSNEKFYSEWNESGSKALIERIAIESENKKESNFNLETPVKSDDNFTIKEHFSKRNDSPNSFKAEESGERQKETNVRKESKKNLRFSNSGSITSANGMISGISTQLQDSPITLGITRYKSDLKIKPLKVDDDVIPETLKEVGTDGIIRFLSAKVTLLSSQLETIRRDEKKYLEKIKELQIHRDKSVEERDKLLQQAHISKNVLVRYEKHVESMAGQMQSALTENCFLKKESEALKKEVRNNNKNQNTTELKLSKTLEEVERLKTNIQQLKQEFKDFKDLQRKKTEDLSTTVRNLDRQRSELLNAFKKQLVLIDNLKRHKGIIEFGKLLKSTEDDFINFLKCNPSHTMRQADF